MMFDVVVVSLCIFLLLQYGLCRMTFQLSTMNDGMTNRMVLSTAALRNVCMNSSFRFLSLLLAVTVALSFPVTVRDEYWMPIVVCPSPSLPSEIYMAKYENAIRLFGTSYFECNTRGKESRASVEGILGIMEPHGSIQ